MIAIVCWGLTLASVSLATESPSAPRLDLQTLECTLFEHVGADSGLSLAGVHNLALDPEACLWAVTGRAIARTCGAGCQLIRPGSVTGLAFDAQGNLQTCTNGRFAIFYRYQGHETPLEGQWQGKSVFTSGLLALTQKEYEKDETTITVWLVNCQCPGVVGIGPRLFQSGLDTYTNAHFDHNFITNARPDRDAFTHVHPDRDAFTNARPDRDAAANAHPNPTTSASSRRYSNAVWALAVFTKGPANLPRTHQPRSSLAQLAPSTP